MKTKMISALICLSFANISYGIYYKCPNIKENIYHSIFSEVDEWQVYAVNNNNKTIYKFRTQNIEKEWSDYNIEIIFNKDMSILFCSTQNLNIQSLVKNENKIVTGEVRALKFVDEVNCKIDFAGQGFNCGD